MAAGYECAATLALVARCDDGRLLCQEIGRVPTQRTPATPGGHVTLGPIQMMVIAFPESRFNGEIRPRVEELVKQGMVRLVDVLLVQKADDGSVEVTELDETDDEIKALGGDLAEQLDLVSAEDAEEMAADLQPGGSGLILVLEHAWMKPLDDAIADSGGTVVVNINVPHEVVDEVMTAVESV
jgi:Family of unknown function (DUF6325)